MDDALSAAVVPLRLAVALAAALPGSLPGQDDSRPTQQSVVTPAEAVQAQRAFERRRRWLLPQAAARFTERRVERIGRFRYFHDDDTSPGPTVEDDEIVEHRDRLIALLDSLRTDHPGSEWLDGQLVRYLVEAGRIVDAHRAASSCRSSPWWCPALLGFAAHLSQRYARADSLFAVSLDAMPEEERCVWTDLSVLLRGDVAKQYRVQQCADRGPLNDRLFWLADPFYAIPGNDRRTEHYARHVMDGFYRQTETPHGLRWGKDYRELILRYGWSERWEAEPRDRGVGEPSVIGHERPGGRSFLPPPPLALTPEAAGWHDWSLDAVDARERYAPLYARRVGLLDAQVAVFRRDKGVLVVGATTVPRDEEEDEAAPTVGQAALALTPAPDRFAIVRDDRAIGVARLALAAPPHSGILSLEALNLREGVAARRRFWLDVPAFEPDQIALSHLLLVDPVLPLPGTLDAAIEGALPSTTLLAGNPIHVYWEVYGADGRVVPFALTVIKEGKGFLRRAAEWLGLADRDKPTVRMQWERPVASPRESLAIAVQLPPGEAGSFTLRLQAITDPGRPVTAERRIDISRQSER